MISFVPSLDAEAAHIELGRLINFDIDVQQFQNSIRRLNDRFEIYAATCPTPFIAPGLTITPEIRRQSELYLPIAEIADIFYRLYRYALTYPPILSSTFFHKALSWADVFVALPEHFQFSANPARLLETLLSDQSLLTEFLFTSFMPKRFYGGFKRYPGQFEFLREWLGKRKKNGGTGLRCLDAACGAGEDIYGLANLLIENGYPPEGIRIEGWTLEPLEVWAAAHCRFPYDQQREAILRTETRRIFELEYHRRICFRCLDLTKIPLDPALQSEVEGDFGPFDLILCNGLLGGPIINEQEQLQLIVSGLANFLAQGGVLLAADNFHGGWKSKCRNVDLKELFLRAGLNSYVVRT